MDRLSTLPDDVLVSIMSFLPQKTKTQTSAVARRYRNIWKYTEALSVYGNHRNQETITEYINNHLTSYLAPVIRIFKLRIELGNYRFADIPGCLNFVVSRHVEQLYINCDALGFFVPIPDSIFYCNSLRELKICGNSIFFYVPPAASLPSLKRLVIKGLKFMTGLTLQGLLDSACGLEYLYLGLRDIQYRTAYTVHSDSLKRLSITTGDEIKSIHVWTPALKRLNIFDRSLHREDDILGGEPVILRFEKMPTIEEAYLDVSDIDMSSLIKAITSTKKLSICATMAIHLEEEGVMFDKLEQLKICHCEHCKIALPDLLKASPDVSLLDIFIGDGHEPTDFNLIRSPPSILVPESTLERLQTLIWTEYSGQPPALDYMYYIIRNARGLQSVDISFREEVRFTKNLRKDLLRLERASPALKLNIKVNEKEDSESESEGD